MDKKTFRNLFFLILMIAASLITAASETSAQSRPRQVRSETAATATRPRRAKSPSSSTLSEKAAAKRVDAFLKRLDQMVEDYMRSMNSQR